MVGPKFLNSHFLKGGPMSAPRAKSLGTRVGRGTPPLYRSRTFEFDPEENLITITIDVSKETERSWVMMGPRKKPYTFPPGRYVLTFTKNTPQQLVRVKIDPDPGGGVVP